MEVLFIFGLLVGPVVGFMVWTSINKKYRNAEARYVPEAVVAQSAFDIKADDHYRQEIVSNHPQILGRNDDKPTVPADYFKAVKK